MHGLSTHLSDLVQFDRVANAAAVGTTDVTSSSVNLGSDEGFDSVLFVWALGTITDGTPAAHVEQSSDDGSSDSFADLAGTEVTIAATDDNRLIVVDVRNCREQYLRSVLIRGGSTGAVVDGCVAIKYDSRKAPVTQTSDVAGHEKHVGPAEGTK